MLRTFGHYATFLEFAGLEIVVVVAAAWSLISVRRSLKRDRANDARTLPDTHPTE